MKDTAVTPKFDAVLWLLDQQTLFNAGGVSKDQRAAMAADELDNYRKSFKSLVKAIEREGYEVHTGIEPGAVFVQKKLT